MKKFAIVPILGFAVLFAGCDDDSLVGLTKQMRKGLGVTVELRATPNDGCAHEQLLKVVKEFRALPKAKRAEVKAAFTANVKKVVINRTETSQLAQGEVVSLVLYRRLCDNATCWNNVLGSKSISDSRKYEGAKPATRLERGEVLGITTQALRDESLRKDYWTNSLETYDKSESVTDPAFIAGRQNGSIWLNQELATPKVTCGTYVTLGKILDWNGENR